MKFIFVKFFILAFFYLSLKIIAYFEALDEILVEKKKRFDASIDFYKK